MSKDDTLNIYEVLELLNKKINSNTSLSKRLDDFKKAIYKNLNQQQQDLVAKEFTNLRNNVSQDMEDLVDRIMNSRIL